MKFTSAECAGRTPKKAAATATRSWSRASGRITELLGWMLFGSKGNTARRESASLRRTALDAFRLTSNDFTLEKQQDRVNPAACARLMQVCRIAVAFCHASAEAALAWDGSSIG